MKTRRKNGISGNDVLYSGQGSQQDKEPNFTPVRRKSSERHYSPHITSSFLSQPSGLWPAVSFLYFTVLRPFTAKYNREGTQIVSVVTHNTQHFWVFPPYTYRLLLRKSNTFSVATKSQESI
jgi:hypothetical protein